MLNRFKLAPKFTFILLLVFILGSSLGGLVLSKTLQRRAEKLVSTEGVMLMESMQAVRTYTDQQIRPFIEARSTSDEFIVESIPAYSARRVFELLEQEMNGTEHADHAYKEAVLNPTNPDDLADAFEQSLVTAFRKNPGIEELSGFRTLSDKGLVFYSALPISVRSQSCLECHGAPEDAPPAMIERYGSKNGFGWRLNQVLGTQIVYIPAAEVFRTARHSFWSVMGVFFGVFAIALLCLNALLKPLVLQPVQYLARISQKLADDDTTAATEMPAAATRKLHNIVRRRDELGQLGRVFQRMVHEVITREQRLQQQIRDLKIEIDEKRRAREVGEIIETDYFQTLQQKAKEIRDRRQNSSH